MSEKETEDLCINTIRMLSADAVEKAKSGHPGLPMGAAAFAYTLWMKHLRFNPHNPDWINRDRFVLSAGHGSMLLYSLLHLTGYDLPIEELKNFRQWGSKCPGHPEYGLTKGVETTTGPLGQGFANAVGMALAERFLADRYNRDEHEIINYFTYVLASDGDLMEGISAEAASFAGQLKLGKLVCIYDSNKSSIEGSTDITFCEDVRKRFEAYGWHVESVKDGNDTKAIDAAIQQAKKTERPSLIIAMTQIGFGSPNKQGSSAAHGSPLGEEELRKTKENLRWPSESPFYIPDPALENFRKSVPRGANLEKEWNDRFESYRQAFPELATELSALLSGSLPAGWEKAIPIFSADEKPMATREASGKTMNAIASKLSLFLGGSADLAPSNKTRLNDFGDVVCGAWDKGARNLHFGVREHAMGAILNGLALSKAIIPFGATYFIFSDYMRAAMRLSAMMKLRVVYVFTHDSIAQGEDGATHQPIEHLASLRAMPGMTVIRPSDATETAEAWRQAIARNSPTALILTRQELPVIDRRKYASADGLRFGAYILKDCTGMPDIIFIATGSEVPLALQASCILDEEGIRSRVVSMPSVEIFEEQSEEYKNRIFPKEVSSRLVIEAGSSFGWRAYAGERGDILGIDEFGTSAPGGIIMERCGFTPKNVVARAKKILDK